MPASKEHPWIKATESSYKRHVTKKRGMDTETVKQKDLTAYIESLRTLYDKKKEEKE